MTDEELEEASYSETHIPLVYEESDIASDIACYYPE